MNRRAWLLVLPLIGAVLCYGRALRGGFVLDDLDSVVRDPAARNLSVSSRLLLPSLLSAGRELSNQAVASAHLGDYKSTGMEGGRGFVAWTLALNHAIGGLDPFGYHIVNLGLHLLVTLLVFAFVRALLLRSAAANPDACALVVAGAFVLHPLNSQAVNYVTQRAEVIASAAYIGALLLVLRASAARLLSALLLLVLALSVFAIGLGTKVIVVTMPIAYLLIVLSLPDHRPGVMRPSWARHSIFTAPFFLLAAWKAHSLLESVKGHSDAGFSVNVPGLNPWTYFITEWKVILIYVRLLFWPPGQNLDWLYPVSTKLDVGVLAAGLTLLGSVTLAVWLFWRARRLDGSGAAAARIVSFGILWFLLILAPTSSFVPVSDLLVEHRAYLASVGLLLAMVVLAESLLRKTSRRLVALSVAVVWIALGVALYQRNAVWETPMLVWTDVAAKRPMNARAHTALATAHQERGDLDSAIREYGEALSRAPETAVEDRVAAMRGMAAALVDSGRVPEAFALIQVAVALKPRDPEVLATLAAVDVFAGNLQDAERAAQAALTEQPRHTRALLVLGEIGIVRQDAAEAAHYLGLAVEAEPDEPVRLLEYGTALAKLGRSEEACGAWRSAMQSPRAREDDRKNAAQFSSALRCPTRGL